MTLLIFFAGVLVGGLGMMLVIGLCWAAGQNEAMWGASDEESLERVR